jgi:hypothetical protein
MKLSLNLATLFVNLSPVSAAFVPSPDSGPRMSSAVASTIDASPTAKPMFDGFLDEEALFAKSTFPIKPDDLMARAKHVLGAEVDIGTKDGGECLADDFEFCAAVVGPIGKEEYVNALGTFKLEDAFGVCCSAYRELLTVTFPVSHTHEIP